MGEFNKMAMKETRGLAEFQTRDEYVEAMIEDLSDWFNYLYHLQNDDALTPVNFFTQLNDGVILCKHAHLVQTLAELHIKSSGFTDRRLPLKIGNQILHVPFQAPCFTIVDFTKSISRFHARDNVSNFISWCRNFNIPTSLTFETDDLTLSKNPRNVVIALLEVSRIGSIFGMEVPDIIQLEQDIEQEINGDQGSSNAFGLSEWPRTGMDAPQLEQEINDEQALGLNWKKDSPNDNVDNYTYVETFDSETFIQENNSAINNRLKSPKKNLKFGFNSRRSSLSIPNHNFTDPRYKNHVMRRASIDDLNNNETPPDTIRFDNSDTESNFSQNSHSKFSIPTHKTVRPIGRVKIYDQFDQSNYVKEKKNREKVDLRTLDERVCEVLQQCQCEDTFLMKRVGDGKYQWGDKNTMIFIRILRTHVMVRVGGGWNTLNDFLYKHDPCRKEKCAAFKFCLPSQNIKSSLSCIENKLISQSTPTSSGIMMQFGHDSCRERKISKRNISESEDRHEIRILEEDRNKTDDNLNKENGVEQSGESVPKESDHVTVTEVTNTDIPLPSSNDVHSTEGHSHRIQSFSSHIPKPLQTSPINTTHGSIDSHSLKHNNNHTVPINNEMKKRSRIPRLKQISKQI